MSGSKQPSEPPSPPAGNTRELVVHAQELLAADGQTFLERVDGELSEGLETLVINLIAGRELSPTGVSILLKARVTARRRGVRFLIRPSNKSVTGYLIGLGLERVLVGAT